MISSALLIALVGLAHAPLLGVGTRLVLSLQLALLGAAVVTRQSAVFHAALLAALVTVIAAAEPLRTTLGALPVVPLLLPLLSSSAISHAIDWARLPRWLQRGQIEASSWAITFMTGIVSAGALIVWARWTDNLGVGAGMMRGATQAVPTPVLAIVGIPVFAVVNAATEEAVYRGVLQRALELSMPRLSLVVALQALAFAALHFQSGFPNGLVGYAMVTIYGAALGYLRHRTGGLAAPIVAHVLADLVIGYVLLANAFGS